MNNNNTPALLRSLIIYALCVPLAIWIGYLLAQPLDRENLIIAGIMALLLCAPILLRWHHFLLIATWNLTITIFFLPGKPQIWLLMSCLSLGIAIVQRTVNSEMRFISAPQITLPVVYLVGVVLVTARLTGGIGLHSLGNAVSGGRNYFFILIGIAGYFAMTSRRIPPNRAFLYVALFFLGGCTDAIGDLAPYVPSALYPIFLFFPVTGYDLESAFGAERNLRFSGFGQAGYDGFLCLLAVYGLRGIFLERKFWRVALLFLAGVFMLLGGFRSVLIMCVMVFAMQFFLERMQRTKLLPAFIFCGVIGVTLLIPFARYLPFTFQRSLAFLPLTIRTDARMDAQSTEDWRLQIWKNMLPQVPKYLLLGKGYALNESVLQFGGINGQVLNKVSEEQEIEDVGNYHSGPLSVVIPFGIWGVIAVLWLWVASLQVLYKNYRYGETKFLVVNAFLLAYYIAKIILFLVIFGGFFGDLPGFLALIALSLCLNNGIRRRAPKQIVAPPAQTARTLTPHFQPFLQR
ncbi:MAG TPA: O-antigen ligase family protein [Verrucomicrobiae bacterium]